MIIECLVTKNLSTSVQSEMGTAGTGMCVCSHVTDDGVAVCNENFHDRISELVTVC